MYYTYIIECSDGTLYTGITTDIVRRFAEHSGNGILGAKYTKVHGVKSVAALWSAPDRSSASKLEHRIKTLKKPQKLALISGSATLSNFFGYEFTEVFSRAEIPKDLKNNTIGDSKVK